MGVKGFLSLLQDCPEARRSESIKKLSDDHQRYVSSPVLVVDGSNFIPWLYTGGKYSLPCIYGGQWIQFREIIQDFISKFQREGIKLVFIFDGTISEEKLTEWAYRRMSRYEKIAEIFDDISQNLQENAISCSMVSPGVKLLAKYALKELGVEMYQTDKQVDADNCIANYANSHGEVFAILSDDTDFIIFDTKPVLSLSNMDLNNFTTFKYDRNVVAKSLKISPKQLPLFACLMGNDYVPFDDLKPFHHHIVKGERPFKVAKVKNLCKLIKESKWNGDYTDTSELSAISLAVFGQVKSKSDLLKRGLKSYVIDNGATPLTLCMAMSPDFEQAAHERHFDCSNAYIYNVLCKKEYGSSEVLEGGTRFPSALVYREIRQRCYGLLFNCFAEPDLARSVVIDERCWYKRNNIENNLNEPEKISPLGLRNISDVIKIEDLWLNCDEARRFEFFWHVLQIPMELDFLMKLPEDQVALSCILNYLIGGLKSGPLLKPLDVAVFVAQAVWKPSPDDIKRLKNPWVHAATVNLSTLFVSGIEAVFMALETCGFPFPYRYTMPWQFFDGKLFHFLHHKAKQSPRIRVLCNDQDEIVERFYQLLPIVTDNTMYDPSKFDWSDILKDF